ncbi:hypothetical protein Oscil6304_4297 [Oscillatoria acuminata PCC 6304]|uniref:DUF4177 domain-containing protein n=1 Tax=Oscillatoria acuminata PCC 6304 TaxID=56110 RepID=K9TN59_9CYAN|nr:hypothetical protein Oscil6304_4297 [Oscillatoria acuminata PCC 6304]
MKYEYKVIVSDWEKVNIECNTLGQQNWELVTAYSSARTNCCSQTIPTVVLIFKKSL